MVDCPLTHSLSADQLKRLIREVPDFPRKGILFYDITTFAEGQRSVFATLVDRLSEHYLKQNIDLVLGMEAPRIHLAPALGIPLDAGICSRAQVGQTSGGNRQFDYALEYGTKLAGNA